MMNNNNNNDNNTMNNNDNNNDNTMSYSFDHSGSGFPLAEAVPSTPAQQQQQPGTSSALYKVAARNLCEYHGVPSMTALKLEKTVTLLGLRPRRLVAQGLAPRRLLKDNSSPLVLAGGSSDEGQKALCEADSGALMDASGDDVITNNYSSSEDTEEEDQEVSSSARDDDGDSIDNINLNIGDNGVDDAKEAVEGLKAGKKKRPIHAALVAGGIDVPPSETRPLLRALGVSPHRLVKLGLVKREAIHAMPGRRGGGTGPGQHLRARGPGKRGVGRPRGPPHGPPRRPFHGAGCHPLHRGEQGDGGGMSCLGPHAGPEQRGPRHHGGPLQGPLGPGHHSMPTVVHERGPPGGGKHGHGQGRPLHHGPAYGRGHGHHAGGFQSEGEGRAGEHLRNARGGGRGQHGPRRHGGGMGRPRGPPHGPPHAHGGPQHRGPPRHGGGGEGRSPGRPQGPPRGPPRGHFHRLFHQPELEAY